jgi:hypothetical protein
MNAELYRPADNQASGYGYKVDSCVLIIDGRHWRSELPINSGDAISLTNQGEQIVAAVNKFSQDEDLRLRPR